MRANRAGTGETGRNINRCPERKSDQRSDTRHGHEPARHLILSRELYQDIVQSTELFP